MVDKDAVIAAIRKVCDIDANTTLPLNAPLWGMGMDSLRVMELVVVLEGELDVIFPDEDLVGDTFATVESILDVMWKLST